ncbi:13555_t:CDS:2, partial [Cetraspora pellucida]
DDEVEIDVDRTKYYSYVHDFDTSIIRKVSSSSDFGALARVRLNYSSLKDREYEDYKEKYEDALKEIDRLKNERIGENRRHNNEILNKERENAALRVENTRKDEQLTSANNQVIDLSRRLENKEEEVGIVRREKEEQAIMFENKLDQKSTLLENVRQSLRDLEIRNEREKSEKDSEVREKDSELRTKEEELKRKGEEVKRAQRKADQSQEELLTEKIRIKYEKLEIFANRIEINLQQVNDLCRYCERLIRTRKSGNQVNIETHEDNIARVREGLRQRGLQIENIQKFCNKCEKIAKLRVELSEIRQQQQQYEARQEAKEEKLAEEIRLMEELLKGIKERDEIMKE